MPPKPKIDRSWTSNADQDYEPYDGAASANANADAIIFGETVHRPVWRDGQMMIGPFKCTSLGLKLVRDNVSIKDKDMQVLAETLRYMQGGLQWLIGDFALTAEHIRWGDLPQLAESLGLEYNTLRDYMYVCRGVQLSVRTDKLSFAHHKLVADRSPDEQRALLQHALENKLSVTQFRAWLRPKPQLDAPGGGLDYSAAIRSLRKLLALPSLNQEQRRQLSDLVRAVGALLDEAQRKLNATYGQDD